MNPIVAIVIGVLVIVFAVLAVSKYIHDSNTEVEHHTINTGDSVNTTLKYNHKFTAQRRTDKPYKM